jgi:pimeloyl-ACP methyl ester carboxylesterase
MATCQGHRPRQALGATALAAILAVTIAPAWSAAGPTGRREESVSAPFVGIAEVDEHVERAVLGSRNAPGVLVQVSAGSPGGGVGVTVHGINARCSDIAALTQELADRGAATLTFVYDDHYRRLRDSAADLAEALRLQLDARPDEPLAVQAHSMGSRIVLVALERLGREAALDGRDVEVDLVAPPLGGYASADLARLTPWPLSRIKNAQPGIDMGRSSRFQRRLQSLSLPAHVRVRVFLGTNDRIVDPGDRRLWEVIERVRAEVVRLPGATHMSSIGAAADWLRAKRVGRGRRPVAPPPSSKSASRGDDLEPPS